MGIKNILKIKTLAQAMSATICLIILISNLSITIFLYLRLTSYTVDTYSRNTQEIIKQNQQHADFIAQSLSNYYRQISVNENLQKLITTWGVSSDFDQENIRALRYHMDLIRKSNPYIHSILYFRMPFFSTGIPEYRFLRYKPDYFFDPELNQQVWETPGETLWYPPKTISEISYDQKLISLIHGIRGRVFEKEEGYLQINIDPVIFFDSLKTSAIGEEGYLFVLDPQGTIISHPDFDLLGEKPVNSNALLKAIHNHEKLNEKAELPERYNFFSFYSTIDHEAQLISYSRSDVTGWYFIGLTSLKELTKEGANLVKLFVILQLFLTVIVVIITFRQVHRLLDPLVIINQQMKKFQDGSLSVRIKENFPYEFTKLKESFNRMADQIEQDFKKIIHSEKMISVGNLATGVAHEINNPLAGIIQNLQVLERRLNGDLKKNEAVAKEVGLDLNILNAYLEKRDILRMISHAKSSGGKAAAIVRNMLSFSRKSDGSLTMESLSSIVDVAINLAQKEYNLKKQYDFKNIMITREYDSTAPLIQCQPSEIEQVILNILKNGAQAMAEAKTEDEEFLITIKDGRDFVILSIADNGPGIPEEKLNKIFDPFFTTKPVGIGTGLGMSIAYFIITEHHNGTIEVENRPEGGAVFTIRLPKPGTVNPDRERL